MYDVIIIGSGPAGLTASIYAVRASLKTLVIAGYIGGGQLMLTTLVENYPGFAEGILGPELMGNMRQQAENLGVEFVDQDAVEVDVSKRPFAVYTKFPLEAGNSLMSLRGVSEASDVAISTKKKIAALPLVARNDDLELSPPSSYQSKSLIIATGADTKWLEVPGEKELIGKGVSSCAPCDAFFFRNKNVAVVGGGDSAMEEALVLTKVANSVTIIHRKNAFRASQIMQDRVFANPKIKVIWNTQVLEVLGKEKVTGLKLKTVNSKQLTDNKENYSSSEARSQKDSSRPAVSNNNVKEWELPIDGVFVAIGHKPNSEKFLGKIDLDQKGYVKRKEVFENNLLKYWSVTNVDGVFVAGDVHDYRYKQAVTAAGFGCMAAMDVEKWLDENK